MSGCASRVDTDAAGDERVVMVADTSPRPRVSAPIDTTPEQRRAAWIADPRCAHCAEPIASVDDCAVVPTEFKNATPRVAHKDKTDADGRHCFVAAVQRHNPTFSRRRALEREERS